MASWFVALRREHIPGDATNVLGLLTWVPEPPCNRRGNAREELEQGAQGSCGLGWAGRFLWLTPN